MRILAALELFEAAVLAAQAMGPGGAAHPFRKDWREDAGQHDAVENAAQTSSASTRLVPCPQRH